MGSFSVSTPRGLVHWQGLLLAVSLLNFWCLPTIAQFAIESINVGVGQDVHLKLRNTPPGAFGFVWYRGEGERHRLTIGEILLSPLRLSQKGLKHSGREEILPDGSLLIRKVTMRDRGMFTVVAHLPDNIKEIGFGRLNVFEPVRSPILLASRTTVKENKDAVLFLCNTDQVSMQWLFYSENLQLSERMKLSNDHRLLTIDPVKKEDVGYYQCEVSNPISSAKSWPIWLDVNHE